MSTVCSRFSAPAICQEEGTKADREFQPTLWWPLFRPLRSKRPSYHRGGRVCLYPRGAPPHHAPHPPAESQKKPYTRQPRARKALHTPLGVSSSPRTQGKIHQLGTTFFPLQQRITEENRNIRFSYESSLLISSGRHARFGLCRSWATRIHGNGCHSSIVTRACALGRKQK